MSQIIFPSLGKKDTLRNKQKRKLEEERRKLPPIVLVCIANLSLLFLHSGPGRPSLRGQD